MQFLLDQCCKYDQVESYDLLRLDTSTNINKSFQIICVYDSVKMCERICTNYPYLLNYIEGMLNCVNNGSLKTLKYIVSTNSCDITHNNHEALKLAILNDNIEMTKWLFRHVYDKDKIEIPDLSSIYLMTMVCSDYTTCRWLYKHYHQYININEDLREQLKK